MLVHRRMPSLGPAPKPEESGRPIRAVASDLAAQFLRATKPRARAGAGVAAVGLLWAFRALLWINLQVAGFAGIATLYVLGKFWRVFTVLRDFVPLAVIAVLMVFVKALYRLALVPFQHVALTVVAVGIGIEVLLTGRVITQIGYKDDVGGIGGTLLSLTNGLVAPFEEFEGTAVLHDTGVVEFATLTAMEAYLVATIAIVLALTFWSEFLHMYRRVRDFFVARSLRHQTRKTMAETEPEAPAQAPPVMVMDSTQTADLSAAS